MINKNIEEITKDDLQDLIKNEVFEQKTIEYKQSLPGNSDSDKKEFLADVSSFANASGGDIIYGMIEDSQTGKPKSLDGLDIENPDKEILRLEGIIRTGLQPRLPSHTIPPPIPLENSKVAIIIRVPKSWISPHGVFYGGKKHGKFYSRSSNGKHPMDVGELRTAFNLSETIIERIRNFRIDRIAKIIADETPVTLYNNPKIILHLISIISFNPAQSYDINKIASNPSCLPPMHSANNWRYNLDGFVTYLEGQDGKSVSYAQFFRNGILEAVESVLLEPNGENHLIPSISYEGILIKCLDIYFSLYKVLNVATPIFVYLTLLGVKGYQMAVSNRYPFARGEKIDRDILQLPEIVVESYEVKAEDVLKSSFDSIWNACGFPRDLYYKENGEWAPR